MSDQIKQLKKEIERLEDSAAYEEGVEHAMRAQNKPDLAQQAMAKRNNLLDQLSAKEEQLTALEEQAASA